MQQINKYKTVGLFMFIGILLLTGIIFNYLNQKFTTNDDDLVVMYFEESIQGLSVGSSVVLQGVEIGQVKKIELVADLTEGTFLTPVYVLFDKKKISENKKNIKVTKHHILQRLIAKGLKAKLISANILTGQLMIALVMEPNQPIVLYGKDKSKEIPTTLSDFEKLSKDLTAIPLHETLTRLGDVLIDMDKMLPTILSNTAQITKKMDKMLDQKSGELSKTMNNVNSTMEEIAKASRSIKNLTDYLERHPEALIRGKEK